MVEKFAKEKPKPKNKPPEEIIIDGKFTYFLRNAKSSRELTQKKLFQK